MINKEFYERILVAKFLQIEITSAIDIELTIRDAYYYIQTPKDNNTIDYLWFNTLGGYATWENHLEYICFQALEIQQPGYSPFTVDLSLIETNKEYLNWYYSEWLYYISYLVHKYKYLWQPKLKSKTVEGMVDIIEIINKDMAPYID